jgi:mannose-6-phosphate isomerase-like protein (cupin superfamily)
MTLPTPVNLRAAVADVSDHWSPRVVAACNGQYLKVAKVQGEFVWHQHAGEDELFLILKGTLRIQFEEGEVVLREGECLVVPRGVRHNPVAEEECWLALFEPAATAHTGEMVTGRTKSIEEQTAHLRGAP